MKVPTFLLLALAALVSTVTAKMKAHDPHNKFCGSTLCYDLLEVTEDATEEEIRKSFRRLAREYHPDKNPEKSAHIKFKKIAKAYEAVGNEEARKQYDFLMKNKQEYIKLYGHVYYFDTAPKANLLFVVALLIVISSAIHFLMLKHKYTTQVERVVAAIVEGRGPGGGGTKETLEWHNLAVEKYLAQQQTDKASRPKKVKSLKKDDQFKEFVEGLVGELDIGIAPPVITDTVGVAILKLPITLPQTLPFQISWFVKHTLQGQPLSEDEKEYLMKRALGEEWDTLSEEDQQSLMRAEAWDSDNLAAWRDKKKKLKKRR